MKKNNLKSQGVCVFMGGCSGERAVSLESGKNVLQGLITSGISAYPFDPQKKSLQELLDKKPSAVFMILHGQPGEDGRYQGFFDLHQIPYTGSGMESSALCLNKLVSKTLWQKAGIPTPEFLIVADNDGSDKKTYDKFVKDLGSPIVIKPSSEGSSLGITIVKKYSQWASALKSARKYKGAVLAEKYIKGDEYTFGVIGGKALPGILIKYQNEFYDYKAKYKDDSTKLICPCGLEPKLEKQLQQLSLKAAKLLGCRGWYRVDFIVDKNNKPYVIEINTAPGMTSHSLLPKAAGVMGWSYKQTVNKILDLATFDKIEK